jgi:hypothetical protein
MQLKTSEIKSYRENQLAAQNYICPLCRRRIEPTEAALDHCHRTGMVRRVVHRWCNAVLGRIENWAGRSGIDRIAFIKYTVLYLEADTTKVLHPTHGKRKKRVRRRK